MLAGESSLSVIFLGVPGVSACRRRDAIADGKRGILMKPEDFEHTAQWIVVLLRDHEDRSKLGDHAVMRGDINLAGGRIFGDYEKLLESRAGASQLPQ